MAETDASKLTHEHDGSQAHTHGAGHALDHEHDEWGFDLIDHHGDDGPLTDEQIADLLSSRFVVVNREVLWRSPILLTPYRDDNTIDSDQLDGFIHNSYREAGLQRSDVDSGAVILTGEAL